MATDSTQALGWSAQQHQSPHTLKKLYDTLGDYADRMALRFAVPAALLSGLATWLLNWGNDPIPFTSDPWGFGILTFWFSIIAAFLSSAIGFVLGLRYRNSLVPKEFQRSWIWGVLPLAIAYTVVVGLFAALGLQFVDMVFSGLALPKVYAVAIVALVCGLVAHTVATQSMQVRVRTVMGLFVITLLAGVSISAITINNTMWWEHSFSFLGESNERSHYIFNATMIVSGVLVLILQQFLMDDFVFLRDIGLLTQRKLHWVRGGFIALGLLLTMIGIVPYGTDNVTNTIHDLSAYSIAGVLLVFMLMARRLLPQLPREFFVTTWVMVALLVGAVLLHFVGSINTVGVELLAFAIGGTWLLLFIKNVETFVERLSRDEPVLTASQ
jgi:hypothetical protein